MGWMPIETAPRDGTKVDVWMEVYPSPRSMGWGDSFRACDVWWADGAWVRMHQGKPTELFDGYITHWMPLPAPPAQPQKGTDDE